MEQTSTAAASLEDEASRLAGLVATFQLRDDAAALPSTGVPQSAHERPASSPSDNNHQPERTSLTGNALAHAGDSDANYSASPSSSSESNTNDDRELRRPNASRQEVEEWESF